ncbi:tripartite tricarboxylate transporter substrate binding protein [Hydrogenophaga sp.]|uniref:Bug family tripartite tricarboxylate transporter substrate binding protein n=1 Tax=Hydrogenophaga sp. TaxID=1904254 RepID=UPI00263240B5|nr:tripartite tricarboxylate transporter substrate binding protein [Hydrogenophaga sp.]MCW5653590.1 tripartite tricarboxylate transporter substrate binding protein [Hydrogenophaga sp.]
MKHPFLTALIVATSVVSATHASAQSTWPERTVKIVVPYPAGPGPADTIARILGEKLAKQLGQPFVVENKPGASGNISTEYAVRSPADGYTLLLGAIGPMAINPNIFKSLSFDVSKDLQPVSFVGTENFVLVTGTSTGVTSLKDLVVRAKEKPDAFSYGSSGVGSGTHLAGELFQRAAGIRLLHVPYRGGTSVINDVLAGTIPLNFTSAPLAAIHQKSGKLNVLAVTSNVRTTLLPDAPTMSEAGYPEAQFTSWYGFFVPAQTPKPIVDRIHSQINLALEDPDARKRIADIGLTLRPMTIDGFKSFVKDETARIQGLVRSANITAE